MIMGAARNGMPHGNCYLGPASREVPLRSYFDTDDGTGFIEDNAGLDLYGLTEARLQAQAALADIARDHVPAGGTERTMTCRVRDETGKTVLLASLVLMLKELP